MAFGARIFLLIGGCFDGICAYIFMNGKKQDRALFNVCGHFLAFGFKSQARPGRESKARRSNPRRASMGCRLNKGDLVTAK